MPDATTIARDANAKAAYLGHRAIGFRDNLKFSNAGEAAITLSGDPGQNTGAGGAVLDADADLNDREFVIAKQTNFPPTDRIRKGAQIWFPASETNYYYEVQRWEAEGEASDGVAAVYRIIARRVQIRRLK